MFLRNRVARALSVRALSVRALSRGDELATRYTLRRNVANIMKICFLIVTLQLISKSNRSTFDRLLNLVKIDDNRSELRAHMEGIKLPCIPFLGE